VTEAIEQIQRTASLLVPEIILLATVCSLFLAGPLAVSDAGEATPGLRHRWGFLSLLGIGIATIIWSGGAADTVEQGALFHIDQLVWYTRGITLLGGMLLVLVLWNQIDDAIAAEAHACLLSIVAGTTLVAAASDLVSLFLALELVSIPTYVILYLPRRDRAGREAAIKYFLLSVFSSALVLYGMAWLYGVAGSTNLAAIASTMSSGAPAESALLSIAFALMLAGLCFRITAVPFHFYAPDVFQGTTASNAALLSYVPKVVGFIALVRLLPLSGATANLANWVPNDTARTLLAVLAIATMFVGNLMALRQKSLYRLMAYSSVAHAGYMLIGLAAGDAGTVGGTSALMFYLAVYGLMTIGVFALIGQGAAGGERGAQPAISTIDDLRGLGQLQPATALLLTVCLFSLTGLPPTAGFLGKLNLFLAAWSDGTNTGRMLAAVMAINAAIGAWYYLRLIAVMFLEPAPATQTASRPPRASWPTWLAGAACTVATVAIFLAPQWLWDSLP
jgi:NADH-quinone oxidoreductase subunit N